MKQTCTTLNRLVWILGLAFVLVFTGCSTSGGSSSGDPAPLPDPAPESYREESVSPETADFTLSALEFVENLGAGWNLGNTLDAYVAGQTGLNTETSWGQPVTTQDMMAGLKASGLTTVRIPITWHNHVDSAFTVDEAWMDRVIEVVNYALDEDLYVIINIHHDNEKDVYFPDELHAARSMEFVTRIWKQVALMFRNYDERLIFEILNEPRLTGYANEWNWSDSDSELRTAAEIIGELEQSALDAIRDTGSNNENRYVMITPYVASPWAAKSGYFVIPDDSATDKLILSVHAYTPYVFAMQSPGVSTFTTAHQGEIDSFMGQLNTKFVQGLGMPFIIGEYGATNKNNLDDRDEWFSYYCTKAASYGMTTILWDNGNHEVPSGGSFNELYGFYNREEQTWYFPEILAAILAAYN
ncbi:MAG: Endoglucanase A precursor [Spirochaetes bacterium ADurb.Bin215]|nr:MAG: Endoglucanase A precursor [Spirochaetes bacterium ADurb.Bin215]